MESDGELCVEVGGGGTNNGTTKRLHKDKSIMSEAVAVAKEAGETTFIFYSGG